MASAISRHCALPLLLLMAMMMVLETVRGYNFDISVPTVVQSDGIGISSGFGFSLTQHQFPDGRKVVLVGVPRLNGTDVFGTPVEEGGVLSCPFDNSQNCQIESVFQTKLDGNPDLDGLGVPTLLSDKSQSFDGQLLGYSLRSFKNQVVACAPLYVSVIVRLEVDGEMLDHATPSGRCVVLNGDLSNSISDILQITDFELSGTSFTLAGVDTDIIEQDIGGGVNERIAIGSVHGGAQTGNRPGQVVVTSVEPATLKDVNVTASSLPQVVTEDELLGYRIELGFFTENVVQIAASAPRASGHRGQIRILNIPASGSLPVVYTITGPEPNGYYGYDFVAHQYGQYHSLIVGCPLCNNDRGSLFVYLHSGSLSQPFPDDPVHIPSPAVSIPGRFGTAVAIIGDSDRDGYADVAVSAPYAGERGVVYICRGFKGGLLPPSQVIEASPEANVFGYTLSGGLDIDDNGYPDLTVGDLSGSVTTLRTSPLVTVAMEFDGLQSTLDLVQDKKCSVGDDITLLCFQVMPCFYYEAVHETNISQFAIQYLLTVDGDRPNPRAVRLTNTSSSSSSSSVTVVTENTVANNLTMSGPGSNNRVCSGPFTFAIRADFADTTPIPVRLEISESESVAPLPGGPLSGKLGGPLTPVLRRYSEGDVPMATTISQTISFGLVCSEGPTSDCEPVYTLSPSPSFDIQEPLFLSPGTEFSYDVIVENTALDDGLSPILVLNLGNGVLLNNTVSGEAGDVIGCESSTSSTPRCLLRNPLHSRSSISLKISFRFNTSAIPLTTTSLPITFLLMDGSTGIITNNIITFILLKSEASFGLGVIVSEERYQAHRHALSQNVSTIPLNETGPTVRFSTLVTNSRDRSNGTTVPLSTLIIHIPVAVQPDRNSNYQPLLIPYFFLSGSNDITCNQYDITNEESLSPIQRPPNFLPLGVGGVTPEDDDPLQKECEEQRGELGVRCGRIVCSVKNLEAGRPPSQVTFFAYIFSSSVIVRESYSIFTSVSSSVEGLEIQNITERASFEVLPAVIEVQLECFQYWIIVVSFVAGLLALFILIGALALCGVFRRWYKRRGDRSLASSTETVDGEPSHSSSIYAPRTIPPIPGLMMTGGGGGGGGGVRNEEEEVEKVDLGKEEEAERERQLEAEIMAAESRGETAGVAAGRVRGEEGEREDDIDIPLDDLEYDPHLGVDDDGGDETEI